MQALPRILQNSERYQCATAGLTECTLQQQQKYTDPQQLFVLQNMSPQPCSSSRQAGTTDRSHTLGPKGVFSGNETTFQVASISCPAPTPSRAASPLAAGKELRRCIGKHANEPPKQTLVPDGQQR